MTSTSSWHDAAGRTQPDLTVRKYPLPGSSVLHNSRGGAELGLALFGCLGKIRGSSLADPLPTTRRFCPANRPKDVQSMGIVRRRW